MNWISVEERLPEKGGSYFVYPRPEIEGREYYEAIYGVKFSDFILRSDDEHSFWCVTSDVTHWLPVPMSPDNRR